ncbi:MAG: hypothetical protein KAS05_00785 [Candidatus Omnitrophica bacterium]|nr:hypothetical protein [Candidatus Omnitrophota bacterium]
MKTKFFIFCLLFTALFTSFVYAENASLGDILASPNNFTGKEVQIEGEVIGEPLNDEAGVWVNVSTGQEQIGVFFEDKERIEEIIYWGDYSTTGDQIRVIGVFYKNCPEHQVSDLHLKSLKIIHKGYENEYVISPWKKQLAKILSMICLAMALIYFIKLRYGKRN